MIRSGDAPMLRAASMNEYSRVESAAERTMRTSAAVCTITSATTTFVRLWPRTETIASARTSGGKDIIMSTTRCTALSIQPPK